MFDRFTTNLVGGPKVRYETLDGKQYLVVPTVMLTEGVHVGSQGPLLYRASQLGKNPVVWNHKPIVVYHPTLNGEGISACDPAVVERQRVGLLFNSGYPSKLTTESWIEEDKLKRIAPGVLDTIKSGNPVEVSTGLFHDLLPTPGTWNNQPYDGEVMNILPDHLAILPDGVGACSIAKGGGLLRNADGTELSYSDIREHLRGEVKDKAKVVSGSEYDFAYIEDVFPKYIIYSVGDKMFRHAYKVKSGKATLSGEPEEVRKSTSYVTANKGVLRMALVKNEESEFGLSLPHKDIHTHLPGGELADPARAQQMTNALVEKYSQMKPGSTWDGTITDLGIDYVIWQNSNEEVFRLPYQYDSGIIRFSGEPQAMERYYAYKPKVVAQTTENKETTLPTNNAIHQGANQLVTDPSVTGTGTAPPDKSDGQARGTSPDRTGKINTMITSYGWTEGDRGWLAALSDDQFAKVTAHVKWGAEVAVQPYSYEGIKDRSNVHSNNQQVMTLEQYLATVPPQFREVVRNGVQELEATKATLVKVILANQNNPFSEQFLMTKSIPELRGMAALAGGRPQQVANYSGQADIPMFLTSNTNNQTQQNNSTTDDDVLPIPVYDFSKKSG